MQRLLDFFRLSAYSIMLSFFMIISIFVYKKYIPYELFLREAIPFYKSSFNAQVLFMPQTKKVFKEQKLNSKKNMAKKKNTTTYAKTQGLTPDVINHLLFVIGEILVKQSFKPEKFLFPGFLVNITTDLAKDCKHFSIWSSDFNLFSVNNLG